MNQFNLSDVPETIRFRLTDFLARVENAKTSGSLKRPNQLRRITTVCRQEVNALLSKYSDATTKNYLSHYRKAIQATDPDSLALRYLRLGRVAKSVATNIENAYQAKVATSLTNLILIENPNAYIQQATILLTSDTHIEIALGLMLLTGRRPVELYKTGIITPVKSTDTVASEGTKNTKTNTVMFSGQAKTRNAPGTSNKPYPIPTLTHAPLVIAAFKRLRSTVNLLEASTAQLNSATAKPLSRKCQAKFGNALTPKSLRALYAEICYMKFAPSNCDWIPYYSAILGHKLLLDENGNYATPDMTTARSYKKFNVIL